MLLRKASCAGKAYLPLLWERKFEVYQAEVLSCEPPTAAGATSINTLKCVHLKFLWSSLGGFAWRGKQPHNRQYDVLSISDGSLVGEEFRPALDILKSYYSFYKVLVIRCCYKTV